MPRTLIDFSLILFGSEVCRWYVTCDYFKLGDFWVFLLDLGIVYFHRIIYLNPYLQLWINCLNFCSINSWTSHQQRREYFVVCNLLCHLHILNIVVAPKSISGARPGVKFRVIMLFPQVFLRCAQFSQNPAALCHLRLIAIVMFEIWYMMSDIILQKKRSYHVNKTQDQNTCFCLKICKTHKWIADVSIRIP